MKRLAIAFLVFSLQAGCAGLQFTMAPVDFENPYARLGVVNSAPAAEEEQGVLLRLLPPEKGVEKSREEITLFVKIKNGQGARTKLILNHLDRYHPTPQKEVYRLDSDISFEGQKGTIIQQMEMGNRGEIVKFIRGSHDSKTGKFTIKSWSRTPVFPAGPVKIGETWTYEETMDVRLSSALVKEKNPAPRSVKAESKLTGFAEVKGRRAAVIQSSARQTKEEVLKVLFRTIAFTIHTRIQETLFLDYKTGTVLGRITQSQSETTSAMPGLSDTGQSQAITYLLESR